MFEFEQLVSYSLMPFKRGLRCSPPWRLCESLIWRYESWSSIDRYCSINCGEYHPRYVLCFLWECLPSSFLYGYVPSHVGDRHWQKATAGIIIAGIVSAYVGLFPYAHSQQTDLPTDRTVPTPSFPSMAPYPHIHSSRPLCCGTHHPHLVHPRSSPCERKDEPWPHCSRWGELHFWCITLVRWHLRHKMDGKLTWLASSAARIPEKLSPGTFDYFGSSHQIFHCFVLAGAGFQYAALRGMVWGRAMAVGKTIAESEGLL